MFVWCLYRHKIRANLIFQCIFCVAVDLFGTGHVNLKLVMPLTNNLFCLSL